jgi:hypothetical protein
LPDTIENELRKKYRVDEYFYPKIDMTTDFPNGLLGEIEKTRQLLENNGFSATVGNIHKIMDFKRKLFSKYENEAEGKQALHEYADLVKQKQPVGSFGPIDYYLIVGVVGVLLYVIGKFSGSFLEEAGKIAAQRLLNNDETERRLQEELKIDKDEYNIFSNQSIIIINKNSANVDKLMKTLQKHKKTNVKAKTRKKRQKR